MKTNLNRRSFMGKLGLVLGSGFLCLKQTSKVNASNLNVESECGIRKAIDGLNLFMHATLSYELSLEYRRRNIKITEERIKLLLGHIFAVLDNWIRNPRITLCRYDGKDQGRICYNGDLVFGSYNEKSIHIVDEFCFSLYGKPGDPVYVEYVDD